MPEPTHPSVRNALGIFEALRRLGFPADDIYFLSGTDTVTGETAFFVQLRSQDKVLSINVGAVPSPPEVEEGFAWWNDPTVDSYHRGALYTSCGALQGGRSAMLVVLLKSRGFVFPMNYN